MSQHPCTHASASACAHVARYLLSQAHMHASARKCKCTEAHARGNHARKSGAWLVAVAAWLCLFPAAAFGPSPARIRRLRVACAMGQETRVPDPSPRESMNTYHHLGVQGSTVVCYSGLTPFLACRGRFDASHWAHQIRYAIR
jgi:hypothetical protein